MNWIRRERLYEYSRRRRGRGLIILRNGGEVGSDYPNGSTPDEVRPVRSCSKSFTAVLIAKMVQMGLLTFDTLVCSVITEWASDPLKNKITIRDLMQQRSGMQAIAFQQLTYEQVIALPCGPKAWDYDNVHWLVLAEVIRRLVTVAPHNKISPSHALKDWVLDPAGITLSFWDQLKTGFSQPNMASGANITAPQMARFGEFLRNGAGMPSLLAELVTPSPYPAYCMGFWKTKDQITNIISGNAEPSKALEGDDFAMLGLGNNSVDIRMDRNEVIVRLGDLQQPGDPLFVREEFLDLAARV